MRRLLLVAALAATAAVSSTAARAAPITPVTFCLNGETVTITDTTDKWHGFTMNEQAIHFLTVKAQTTGVFYITGKNGKLHLVTVSLGACAGGSGEEGDDQGDDQGDLGD